MLSNLIQFVLTQRVFVLVMTAALCGFGYRAVTNLPIEAFPDVQDVQVQIVTQYPGQAPEEVERNVTLPIEREMSGVPGPPADRERVLPHLRQVGARQTSMGVTP
jgi:cobalt-zinc-cadmium resistance protein CzcA